MTSPIYSCNEHLDVSWCIPGTKDLHTRMRFLPQKIVTSFPASLVIRQSRLSILHTHLCVYMKFMWSGIILIAPLHSAVSLGYGIRAWCPSYSLRAHCAIRHIPGLLYILQWRSCLLPCDNIMHIYSVLVKCSSRYEHQSCVCWVATSES